MKGLKLAVLLCLVFASWLTLTRSSSSEALKPSSAGMEATEAPTGYDNQTNGFVTQEIFDQAAAVFGKTFAESDGLGPVFNSSSCVRCHLFPVGGGFSSTSVTRAGKFENGIFVPHPGGTVIHTLSIHPDIRESVLPGFDVTTKRMSMSLLGDGFVEAVDDNLLRAIAQEQSARSNGEIRGQVIEVPLLEAPGEMRVGRFGWKNSHASLLSFSGDAFLNEIGITNFLLPSENTSNGSPVDAYDSTPDPEVERDIVELAAIFMRATKAPMRETTFAENKKAIKGERIFDSVGCSICHVKSMTTMPAGSVINGGTYTVPEALGNKIIRPFSDFLLHDVGTGDGIIDTEPLDTRNKIRTAPLWGLGTRVKTLGDNAMLMHDGGSPTLDEAILRHAGEAASVIKSYRKLKSKKKKLLRAFLESL